MDDNLQDSNGQKIEEMLTPLVKKHGVDAVLKMLDTLLQNSKWDDWQRVANITRNIGRRLDRNAKLRQEAIQFKKELDR